MKKVSLTAVVLALATASAWAHEGHEHGGHHLNNLPASCEAYFKRADACFAKAGESPSSFHATNTMVLKHSLHDATQKQREEMCVYADKHFGDIARKLKCE
ncbi:hypothetical protein [Kingella oralis]|jgi:hypothetical protein|uniref:Uncharacterized protein n=1 Tax=Kingella oralis ATCC 51147 TaxID=629741 RepID=C4GFF7_9NEIS|nr:hypothetical protein [Kingella oralis]EEP68962.1 hypothetical protein GCWU000324_00873 [Kingella oralis ATCC 51147]QMT41880.1 hypothetical protein H3L93_07430 [Kingella oralis]